MTKVLMVGCEAQTLATGEEGNFAGLFQNATETAHQWEAIEAGTFSRMKAKVASGNSGTATYRFRKDTANGNQTFTIAGVNQNVDAVNTDAVVSPNLFNWSYTDTGTDTVLDWIAILYEATSGCGCYHGTSTTASITLSTASTSFYLPISGLPDASADPIARAQWRNRGYTSIDAIAINVASNARTTATLFRVNVNGSPVGTAISIAAAATGRVTLGGQNITLVPGDLVCLEVLTGTGGNNIIINWFNCYAKSTSNEFALIGGRNGQANARAASATPNYYLPGGLNNLDTVEANEQISLGGRTGVARYLQIYVSANTYAADVHFVLRVGGSDSALDVLIPAGQTGLFFDDTHDVVLLAADLFNYSIVGGTSGSLTFHLFSVTIAEHNAVGSSAGSSSVSGTGASLLDTVGSSTGSSTTAATGASLFAAVGSAAGSSVSSAVGASTAEAVGVAAGSSSPAAVGVAVSDATGSAAGDSATAGEASATAEATGSAAGISVAAAAGASIILVSAVGEASGVSAAQAVGEFDPPLIVFPPEYDFFGRPVQVEALSRGEQAEASARSEQQESAARTD